MTTIAIPSMNANTALPSSPSADGGGLTRTCRQTSTAPTIAAIHSICAQRRTALSCRIKLVNSLYAHARLMLGVNHTMTEDERKAMSKRAKEMVDAIIEGEPVSESSEINAAVRPNVVACLPAIVNQNELVDRLDDELEALAEKLPAAEWVSSVRGFGLKSFALIIGETGDLSNYANPAKVWKRMRMSVEVDKESGKARREVGGRRRSIVWIAGDCLVKQNRGEYRALYDARKEYESGRVETKMHAHRRAQRYMEKRLLRDLWRAWREASI